jgi:hypothetical protein
VTTSPHRHHILSARRRGTQVVRERSAKPLRVSSILTRASNLSVACSSLDSCEKRDAAETVGSTALFQFLSAHWIVWEAVCTLGESNLLRRDELLHLVHGLGLVLLRWMCVTQDHVDLGMAQHGGQCDEIDSSLGCPRRRVWRRSENIRATGAPIYRCSTADGCSGLGILWPSCVSNVSFIGLIPVDPGGSGRVKRTRIARQER